MKPTADRIDRIHLIWKLSAIDQHLRPGADGGTNRLDQNFVRAKYRQRLLAEFDLFRRGEVNGPAMHVLFYPRLNLLRFLLPKQIEQNQFDDFGWNTI